MKYKDYRARIEYSEEDQCLVGHIAGITDIIGFHADTVAELQEAFEEAGLHGRIDGAPLGRYVYSKWGAVMDASVLLMEVGRADDSWLEDHRLRRWTSGKEALTLLSKPELREMLRRGMRRLSGGDGRGGHDNATAPSA